MKQTLESAAINELFFSYACTSRNLSFEGLVYDRNAMLNMFRKGAEWQAKQSTWISVEERLPEPDKEVLLYDKNSIRHYVIGWLRRHKGYNKGMWALRNGWVEDKDITHWMPIPYFDEILEANREVLERIKEKGD
ncbi:DUF551 domain-containing protein [Bacteroides fragilis]